MRDMSPHHPRSLIHRTDLVSSIDMAWVSTSLLCCPAKRSPRQISSKMASWQKTIKEPLFKGIVGKLKHKCSRKIGVQLIFPVTAFEKFVSKRFSFWIWFWMYGIALQTCLISMFGKLLDLGSQYSIRDRSGCQNGWIFGKLPSGGWSFSIQKFMLKILDLYIGLFSDVFRKNCNIIFRIWGQRSFGIFPKIHLFHLSQSKRGTRLHVLCILLDNAEHQLGVLPCGSKIEDWLTVGLPPPWSRPSNQTPFFYNNSYQSVRSRDSDEEHDDVLFEAWLEEDHHQGEDLWRLPGPGVWRRRLPRFQDEYYHGPSLEQTG